MFIDDFEEEMIVPKTIKQVSPNFKGINVIVNYFVRDGVLQKRVEANGKEAILFSGYGNEPSNVYSTDFHIINALFVTFTPKTPEDYLCLVGTDEIDFYALSDGMYCSLALPFKISQVHPCNFGLILERSSFPGEFGNPPGAAQLFSLTHPYNEIMPILCKFKADSQCHYTFRNRRIGVVPKEIGANWSSHYTGQMDLIMCYDLDERLNHIFMVRKCTKEERMAAKSDLGVLNSSALMHTPSTVQSFYSPNFFNRRFAETRLATIGLVNAPQKNQQSPAVNPNLFAANTSSHSSTARPNAAAANANNSITSLLATTSSGGFLPHQPHSKHTPKFQNRRITRSMAAAERMAFSANTISGTSLPSSSAADKSPSLHRSLEHNATLNRMRLKQKLAMAAFTGGPNNIFCTPRHGTSFSTQLDMDDLLSFGGNPEDDDPPSSLDMAVEFCLEWIWSEPPTVLEESSTRSGSSSSVGTERVANKLESLRVSSSTSSHSDELGTGKTEVNRMASTFFISRPAFSRSERCIIFQVPSDRRVRVLSMAFFNKKVDNPVAPVIMENTTFIRANAAIPFLHSSFFMVLENYSFSDSLSTASSVSLYTGHFKVANIALNIGMATLLRLLPGGLSSNGHNLYEIRVYAEREEETTGTAESEPFPGDANVFACQFQLGFNTRLASLCLRAICAWLGPDRQQQFLSRVYCSNPWRIVSAAQVIPSIHGVVPVECVEFALLLELLYAECGYKAEEMPFNKLLARIRRNIGEEAQGEDGCSVAKKRTRRELDLLEDDTYWELLKSDQEIIDEALEKFKDLRGLRFVNERLQEALRRILREDRRPKLAEAQPAEEEKTKKPANASVDIHNWVTAPRWTSDLRVHNLQQMLDSSQPILIPTKPTFNDVQQREQHEQFLLAIALRTVTRSFGRAALNFRTRHGFREEPENDDALSILSQMAVPQICLNGRVHPGWHQVDFPLNDTNLPHKQAMEWASFYNAIAHGLSYCGGFPQRLFSATTREDGLPSTVKAGLLLAAGLTGAVRNTMNLYDIHALLTQNDRYLVMALLLGCAAADRGTSEVHIYKMIATHLPFLLQPTLCEFRIELVIQTASLVSLGLLFCETANHTVSSQLLNQMALEVPCESDQSSERYSFVLAAAVAIGLINLGKGKELSDTEIPISSSPSLKDRLIKMLNGEERRLAYLNYDRVLCPGMRLGANASMGGGGSSMRRYSPGGLDSITEPANNAQNAAANQSFTAGPTRDYSGIGQPPSNHVRELPTLNMHLTSPAAALALGLMYLRTKDWWIRRTLEIQDTFYEIDRIRPDMLMIRTLCRCLVDFDDVKATEEWVEAQVPEIIRKYSKHYVEANRKRDLWWAEFIDVETVAKTHFYCVTGACFALALRYASSCDGKALLIIHSLYERLVTSTESEFSWNGLANLAGKNCILSCVNVCAISMALVMAGSGDLQTTRVLRKIRNTLPPDSTASLNLPKDTSVHGLHITLNMALGLLYLGYGRYCLSNSNLAVAALVLSLFPLFPHSITDNRFYFQPIRFLWILAVKQNHKERRLVSTQTKRQEDEERVLCPRCGPIEITKDPKFIY